MAILFTCDCGRLLKAKSECAGKRTKCPHCGSATTIPAESAVGATAMSGIGANSPSSVAGLSNEELGAIRMEESPPPSAAKVTTPTSPTITWEMPTTSAASETTDAPVDQDAERQYRVLTHKDMGFSTRFDSAKLEETLNRFARRGWTVKASVVLNIPSHSGPHDELVVILER